jgi:hypothetical protein
MQIADALTVEGALTATSISGTITPGVGGIAFPGATSGTTTVAASAIAGSTTETLPPVSGTIASTSGANLFIADVFRSTTIQTANANVVPATVTGLVSNTLAVGTYTIRLVLYTTVASGTGGIAITGLLTTAVLGVGNFVTFSGLAATMATTAATSVTSPISFYSAAAIPLLIEVEGTFTVTTPGTLTIQMCQAVSNASNSSVNVGSTMTLTRIA